MGLLKLCRGDEMKQLKISNQWTKRFFGIARDLYTSEFAKRRQPEVKAKCYFLAISWYPEKQVILATDALMMLIWKVNDEELLRWLKQFKNQTFFEYNAGVLEEVELPAQYAKYAAVDYNRFVGRYKSYSKFEELDVETLESLGVNYSTILLEYACIVSRTRFRPIHFERISSLGECNTIEYDETKEEHPVMLKMNEHRLMCVVMPLRKDKIMRYDKK